MSLYHYNLTNFLTFPLEGKISFWRWKDFTHLFDGHAFFWSMISNIQETGGFNKMCFCIFYKYKEMFLMILFFCYSFLRTCLNFSIASLLFLTLYLLNTPVQYIVHSWPLFPSVFNNFKYHVRMWYCYRRTHKTTKWEYEQYSVESQMRKMKGEIHKACECVCVCECVKLHEDMLWSLLM